MGYPIEIPNRIPDPRPVPIEHPVPGFFHRCTAALRRLWSRRRRTLADHPDRYRQGVDLKAPPLTREDAQHLDPDKLIE